MTPAGAGVLVGENRAFAYTHNSGETWQKVDLVAAEADRVPYFQDLTNARLYGDIAIFQANNRVFMVELPSAAPPQPPKPTAPQILRSGAIRK
jgi:hypothetical protein